MQHRTVSKFMNSLLAGNLVLVVTIGSVANGLISDYVPSSVSSQILLCLLQLLTLVPQTKDHNVWKLRTMPIPNSNRLVHQKLWKIMGFLSSVIGLICYALSSSFNHLFGDWNFLKIILYTTVSFSISSMMLILKKWKRSKSFSLKAHVGVLVLLLTSLYSFLSDKAVNGKPDLLSLISCGAFALMCFCLSRQIELGFEADLLNFFLGCLTVQLMEINLMLSIVAAIFCYCFVVLRSKLDSQSQIGTLGREDHVTIEVDDADGGEIGVDDNESELQSDHSNGQQIRLLRRVGDGYNWKKYEDKVVKGNENQVSYYKCTYPNCSVKKKVERTIEGVIIQMHYEGTHPHWKGTQNMKRNSSFEHLYSVLPKTPHYRHEI